MSNIIKTITPVECPHCKKPVYVEFSNKSPEVTSILTPETVELAKGRARERIEALDMDESDKLDVIDWINDPDTIFGISEVDEIVENLKK